MHVAIPSKGRAGRARSLGTLPSSTIYCPELEVAAYRTGGAKHVVGVPNTVRGITPTRNWILRECGHRRVVMIDDDLRTAGYFRLHSHAVQVMRLDEATWLTEFAKIFDITEGLNYRIWGVASDGATRGFYPYHPFRFRSYVTASCMGIINDGRTYFDESYPVKEDYELCCRCITQDGGVVLAEYVFWVNEHFATDGGCKDYRTQAMEADCIKRLRRQYPGLVRIAHRKGNDWAVQITA